MRRRSQDSLEKTKVFASPAGPAFYKKKRLLQTL
jgi:hypothetical protein